MSLIRKILLHDAIGNAINSVNNAINVHTADSHFEILNLHMKKDSGVSETFGVGGASSGDNIFDVSAGQGITFSINDRVKITEGAEMESDILRIVNVSTDTLTVDRPLEKSYTSAGVIEIVDRDLSNGNGAIGSPVIYEISPPSNEVWHINTIVFSIIDGPEPTIEKFGGISGLTNGLVLRQNNGTKRNIVVLKTNEDMKEYFGGHEVEFVQRGGGGDWVTNGIWHYREHTDTVIRIDGTTGDSLQSIIQDDLTDLTEMEIICQGHIEG